jgi:DNA invertase Pin-like site-specific DNA recombinase
MYYATKRVLADSFPIAVARIRIYWHLANALNGVVSSVWALLCGILVLGIVGRSLPYAQPAKPSSEDLTMPAGVAGLRAGHPRGKRAGSGAFPNSSLPCASYSRFSSDLQREESITDQQRKCAEKAASEGLTIAPELEFSDEAVSGTKRHRAGLDAMLAAAEAGKFKTILFHSLSRLARETVITLPLLKHLVYNLRVRIISVTEGIDSNNTAWELIAHVVSIVNEQYIRDLAANVLRGQEGAVLAGLSVGDYCLGYTSVPVPGSEQTRRGRGAKPRKMYIVDPQTAPWVARIFYWFVRERRSLRWIARELNRLAAPKDHRSRKPKWLHQYLPRLLRNRKYIGWWAWGRMANVRDPLSGKIRQEERSPEECEKWLRHLPHLQIIDNETFEQAQRLLKKNDDRSATGRRPDGKLSGSRRGSGAEYPRHMLAGLVQCGRCNSTFYVGGANGKYLFCPNYGAGTCDCQTQLRRDRAETMILERIGKQILANQGWRQAVLEETLKAWNRREAHIPTELSAAKKALAEVEQRISNLLDRIETGQGGPELEERLAQRRAEKLRLTEDVQRLVRADAERKPQPTVAWVDEGLARLGETLSGGNPAAAHALQALVGGRIVVNEIRQPGRQRHYLQGRLTIQVAAVVQGLLGCEGGSVVVVEPARTEEIVIDFREPAQYETESEEAWTLYQKGMLMAEIGTRLGRLKSYVTKLIRHACAVRNLEFLDGRRRRSTLAAKHRVPPKYQAIADEVLRRYDAGQLECEIAIELGCDAATVKKALDEAYAARGEKTPDGRSRRKSLARKTRPTIDGTTDSNQNQ